MEGQLQAHSVHGDVRLNGADGVLRIHFSNEEALGAALPRPRMRAALRYRHLSKLLDQRMEVSVADKRWLTLEAGKLTYHRPLRMFVFAVGQWLRG